MFGLVTTVPVIRVRRHRQAGGEWRGEKQRLRWDILDAFGDAGAERAAVEQAYARAAELRDQERQLAQKLEEIKRRADYLRHVAQEIAGAQVVRQVAKQQVAVPFGSHLQQSACAARLGRGLCDQFLGKIVFKIFQRQRHPI